MILNKKDRNKEIETFIIENIEENSTKIIDLVATKFNITKQAAGLHVKKLEKKGIIVSSGRTRNKIFQLAQEIFNYTFDLSSNIEEDKVWREQISEKIKELPKNVFDICCYGFTEMLNNVIDHSGSDYVIIEMIKTAKYIKFNINDSGIGIFEKIKQSLNLDDHLEALLELSKGKLTTDPKNHSGEGIFFTSKMFDKFSILSGNLFYLHYSNKKDFLLEDREEGVKGTIISMTVNTTSTRTLGSVFKGFESDEGVFSKTIVPVALAQYGDENLISRSQAKRLLKRFEKFREIMLDFSKIDQIGQAFADEIFRVFNNNHPEIKIIPINYNDEVDSMIKRAKERQTDID